jgi:hypothetical protein
LAIASAQAAAVAMTSWLDGSWFLSEGNGFSSEGKGFSQHYGAWAILITDPLLLLASGFLDRQFMVTLVTLPLCRGRAPKRRMWQMMRRYVPFVRGRGAGVLLYALMVVVGFYWWALNVVQTYDPTGSYRHAIFDHHDVFDSGLHIWSFVVFKACLFLSWVIIYPIVGFKFLTVALSTFAILRKTEMEGLVCPRVEHPDGCYGLKNVGTLNIAILAPYLLVFSAIVALWFTHQMIYGSLVVPLTFVTAVFLVTSFIVIRPVYSILCRARLNAYNELVKTCTDAPSKSGADLYRFTVKRFFYSAASASPYSDGTKVLIAAMRAAPVLVLALRFFRPSGG